MDLVLWKDVQETLRNERTRLQSLYTVWKDFTKIFDSDLFWRRRVGLMVTFAFSYFKGFVLFVYNWACIFFFFFLMLTEFSLTDSRGSGSKDY